jgi:hypothetical protein
MPQSTVHGDAIMVGGPDHNAVAALFFIVAWVVDEALHQRVMWEKLPDGSCHAPVPAP